MNEANHAAAMAVRTQGSGPQLVLFHGGMGSWKHWTRNLDALATRFTLHAVDLPGYGDSASVPKSIAQADYIDRVVAGLRPIAGEREFGLAGFSFGGVIAAMTAVRFGTQVRKLSLMGVGGFGPTKKLGMRPIPDPSAGDVARREAFRYNLGKLMLASPASITDEAIDIYEDNYATTRYDGRHFSLSSNVVSSLPHIACPVQFIYGDKDALGGPDLERRATIVRDTHPNATFVVLPGAGHWVQYEAAAQVNALLIEFFGTR
jgi:pimeloyl-ACP methyl ester carboxylesterase